MARQLTLDEKTNIVKLRAQRLIMSEISKKRQKL